MGKTSSDRNKYTERLETQQSYDAIHTLSDQDDSLLNQQHEEEEPDGSGDSHGDSIAAAAAEVQAAAVAALSTDHVQKVFAECALFKEVVAASDPHDELVKDLHASLCRAQAALHDKISLAQGEGDVVDLLAVNDVVEATLAVYQQRVEENLALAAARNEENRNEQQQQRQHQQQTPAAASTTTSLVVGVPLNVAIAEEAAAAAAASVQAPVAASFEDELIDLLGAPSTNIPSSSMASKSDAQLDDEANNLLAEFDSLIGDMGADTNTGNSMQEVAPPITAAPPVTAALVKTASEQEFDAFFVAAAATSSHGHNMVASAV